MPPANSPTDTWTPAQEPVRSTTPFGSAIRELASPVPDFAATLTVAESNNIDSTLSYVRDEEASLHEDITLEVIDRELALEGRRRRQQLREAQQRAQSGAQEERERQFQSHRAHLIQQRHESQAAWAERMSNRTTAAYGDRVPHQQSLYDWAPGHNEAPTDASEAEMQRIMIGIREQQPNTHPEIIRALARVELEAQRRNNGAVDRSSSGPSPEPSLRSAAILQSVSRNWRFSTRSRALMSRYIQDRDRDRAAGQDSVPNESNPQPGSVVLPDSMQPAVDITDTLPSLRRAQNRSPWPPSNPSLLSAGLDRDAASLESLRRRYLENPSAKVTEFERIIKYLHRVRLEDDYSGSLATPTVTLQTNLPGLKMNQEMVRNMGHVRPHPTSWLVPGMTFTGNQQATPYGSSTILYRLAHSNVHASADPTAPRSSTLARSESWLGRSLTSTPQSLAASPAPAPRNPSPPDTWTVKVALHAIDYESMTLQGTMEAFNVPSFTSTPSSIANADPIPTLTAPSNKTTFSTYLEGEIIDFTKHTLLTESDRQFAQKTTPDIDALYWRKLEPFAELSDEEIARALLDRKWIEEQLMGKYVLMRWKERSFVRPTFTSFSNRSISPKWNEGATSATIDLQSTSTPTSSHPASTTSFLAGADGNGYGLSISGFYYVSMRRSDGHCEGLYFDPQSSPYQRLELVPTTGGMWSAGAWEMR